MIQLSLDERPEPLVGHLIVSPATRDGCLCSMTANFSVWSRLTTSLTMNSASSMTQAFVFVRRRLRRLPNSRVAASKRQGHFKVLISSSIRDINRVMLSLQNTIDAKVVSEELSDLPNKCLVGYLLSTLR